jgi:hypothetical protein
MLCFWIRASELLSRSIISPFGFRLPYIWSDSSFITRCLHESQSNVEHSKVSLHPVILKDDHKLHMQIVRFVYFTVQMVMVSEVIISGDPWYRDLYQITIAELASDSIEVQLSVATRSDGHVATCVSDDCVDDVIVQVLCMPGDSDDTHTDRC